MKNGDAVKVKTFVVSGTGELVPVEACGVVFSRDLRIQGGIDLHVGNSLVLWRGYTDTIDSLWSLIVTYIEGFMAGRAGVLNFPERRYTFELKQLSHGKIMAAFSDLKDRRAAVGNDKDVLRALVSGATEFFNAALETHPVDEWSYRRDLNTAERLQEECLSLT